jgi:hypothetical protein
MVARAVGVGHGPCSCLACSVGPMPTEVHVIVRQNESSGARVIRALAADVRREIPNQYVQPCTLPSHLLGSIGSGDSEDRPRIKVLHPRRAERSQVFGRRAEDHNVLIILTTKAEVLYGALDAGGGCDRVEWRCRWLLVSSTGHERARERGAQEQQELTHRDLREKRRWKVVRGEHADADFPFGGSAVVGSFVAS